MSKNIYKVPCYVKKQIENELYHYWENVKELKNLEDDILEASASSDGQPRSNVTSDTTAQKALKLTSTRAIIVLQRRILYIESAIKRLNPEEKKVFEIIFKERYNQKLAETHKNISSSIYYTVYRKIIYLTALEFGLI